jgi:hypothetical protein
MLAIASDELRDTIRLTCDQNKSKIELGMSPAHTV